ncbi:P-loop containing nucleoside triphosphate hydrolase protein [Lineolata rhizophorae]|uniref:Peroxisomal ATPase PEX1 n=1 Tax=Lineolata rhizophorae TaxID=578093 RepID=A0A6A6NT05_9PEZI|nr:P-loop containing nucleoside triphosphate hydrolase protein [Lineolata rhizophorae]
MPLPKRPAQQVAQAEIVPLPSLKNCLVNLPSSLVAVLVNGNIVQQDVVVELNYAQQQAPQSGSKEPRSVQKSVFLGWTGFPSKRKISGVIGRDGLAGRVGTREQDVTTVEIDAAYSRLLGLAEGQKVGVRLHIDPPQAHTIGIEPLTPADWEMIELHDQFLELNFLSQVRALPNPHYNPSSASNNTAKDSATKDSKDSTTSDSPRQPPHPLTLHLSPTSTANFAVQSLTPAPPSSSPFVKISPDAEVHVAPKVRQPPERASGHRTRSSGAASTGGRSGASTVRRGRGGAAGARDEFSRAAVFLRGVNREIVADWFGEDDVEGRDRKGGEEIDRNVGLKVWIDRDILVTRPFRSASFAAVSIVKPGALLEPADHSKDPAGGASSPNEPDKPAIKVITRLARWEDAPDARHAALSSELCAMLGADGLVGGLVRVEPAPPPAAAKSVKGVSVLPFMGAGALQAASAGLRFGGEFKEEREAARQRLSTLFGKGAAQAGHALLEGPLTDGMVLPARVDDAGHAFPGGILRFDLASKSDADAVYAPLWFLGSDRKFALDVKAEIARPAALSKSWEPGEVLPVEPPKMAGVQKVVRQVGQHLAYGSSVLLTGGPGAGKTSLAQVLAHNLRRNLLFHALHFSCAALVMDEPRVGTIKETLGRLFGAAAWGARLGGKSLVILDDVDKLCPVETELEVGGENGRSRQISEIVCQTVRKYCGMESGVVLLATAQSKESCNNVVISGHVIREIVSLKAPSKEGRREVLEIFMKEDAAATTRQGHHEAADGGSRPTSPSSVNADANGWHDGAGIGSRPSTSGGLSDDAPRTALTIKNVRQEGSAGFVVDEDVDFLDIAGQTDGYMPGDLKLIVARARNQALVRALTSDTSQQQRSASDKAIPLGTEDFTKALAGFTPASLLHVTLQSSTTRWDSIGGLHATRQTLLETLQYPTTYAPIFAQCPLRLRSGLMLYGYPGCGKTLLASAVAGECGLNFISVKGPELLNKYIGASEKSVRDLFERAEAARPCVLFFDEFDSIAPKRGHDSTGVTDRVVNQLLTQMDGAEGLSGVYVLAATSRPDLIDPALLRPGRLDKSLLCDLPSEDERVDILKAVARKLRFEESIREDDEAGENFREVARRTAGFSGADLQAVVYNAQLEAIHDVLGDVDLETEGMNGARSKQGGPGKRKTNGVAASSAAKQSRSKSGGVPDFVHFRLDDAELGLEQQREGAASIASISERAVIAARIADMQAARRRQRQLAHLQHRGGSGEAKDERDGGDDEDEEDESKEPIIRWKHVLTALATTRGSIGPDERRRLARIYREFVVGRNGEMPSGQGGSEIGGRTSLM